MSGCLERISEYVQQFLENVFDFLGKFVGERPKVTIFFSLLIVLASCAGFSQWKTENRVEELWVMLIVFLVVFKRCMLIVWVQGWGFLIVST